MGMASPRRLSALFLPPSRFLSPGQVSNRSTLFFRSFSVETISTTIMPRRFAPLKDGSGTNDAKLRGVVFDMDGTLCEPQNYMFGEMRQALGITKATDILDHIYSLPTAKGEQDEAMEKIRDIERTAMKHQKAQPGLEQLMGYLDSRSIRKAICTRNFPTPVDHLLGKFLPDSVIHPVVTREFRPAKPDPAGILFIARSWGLFSPSSSEAKDDDSKQGDASDLIMVGDSIDDMMAGRRAGAATVLLVNDANRHLAEHQDTDLVITRLDELIGVLEDGFVGREIS